MRHGKHYENNITLVGPACKLQPLPFLALQKAQSIAGLASIHRAFSGALLKEAPNPIHQTRAADAGNYETASASVRHGVCRIWHELEYAGSDLFSSRCLLFKSFYKVKRFVHFLAEGQKIGRHGDAAASMAVEAHLAEEEVVMPGSRAGRI